MIVASSTSAMWFSPSSIDGSKTSFSERVSRLLFIDLTTGVAVCKFTTLREREASMIGTLALKKKTRLGSFPGNNHHDTYVSKYFASLGGFIDSSVSTTIKGLHTGSVNSVAHTSLQTKAPPED